MTRNMSGALSGAIDEMLQGSVAGNISFSGGGGSSVTITPTLESGTKIADYSIDGEGGSLYAPTPTEYSAGENISIENGEISATYEAGENITIENGVISALTSGGVSLTPIYESSSQSANIELTDSIFNYDLILIIGADGSYMLSNLYTTSDLSVGSNVSVFNDSVYVWYSITDNDKMSRIASNTGNMYFKKIYGVTL